jgi:hypothetical protein
MDEQPLTAEQRRAANMLAQGEAVGDVAAELSVNPRTVTRWSRLDGVRSLVRQQREALFPADGVPTAEGALLDALSATKGKGEPDHAIRIQAARAILGTPVAGDEAQAAAARVERVYVTPDDDEPQVAPPPTEGGARLSAVSGGGGDRGE